MADNTVAIDVEVLVGDLDKRLKKVEEGLDSIVDKGKEVGDKVGAGFKGAEKGAENASKGVKGFGISIGNAAKMVGKLTIALVVFEKLAELLKSNQRVTNALSTAMVTLEVVFGNAASAVQKLVDGLSSLKSLNPAEIAKLFTQFGDALMHGADGALEQAKHIVDLREKLELATAEQRLFALEQQRLAELQRQERDEIENTIQARIKANDQLAEILTEQVRGETEVADLRIKLRQAELAMNEESIPAQAALIEAEAERKDIAERLTGVLSEQKTNATALRLEHTQYIETLNEGIEASRLYQLENDLLFEEDDTLLEFNRRRTEALDEYVEHLNGTRAFLKEHNKDLTAEQIENHDEMISLERSYNNVLNDIAKEEAEYRRDLQINAATEVATALGNISQMVQAVGAENAAFAKALAVTEIAINAAIATASAIRAAVQSSGNPYQMIAQIAIAVGTVAAAIASATSILNQANVPGPTGSGIAQSVQAAAPSIQPVTTSTTELGNAQAAQLAPIQAFVVETEMTGNQNNISQIENQVTFGIDG